MSSDTEDSESGKTGGLFNSLLTMASTLLAIVETRIELVSTELEEERIRLTSMLMWMLVTLFFAGLGIIFLSVLLVLVLWEKNPLLAIGIPAAVFTLAALVGWQVVLGKKRSKPRLLASTLAELSRDRDRLSPPP